MGIPGAAVGDRSRFFGAIQPLQGLISEVLSHSDLRQDPILFLPAADAKGMSELEAEHEYAEPGIHDRPILTTYSKATMFMVAADDHLESLSRLFAPPDLLSLFTPPVVLRSLLETLGRVHWLMDTSIGTKRRVARGLGESLNLHQQQRLMFKGSLRTEYDRAFNVDALLAHAVSVGFVVGIGKDGERWLDDERRPGANKAIDRLFRGSLMEETPGNIFRRTSAIAHASLHGILGSMEIRPSSGGLGQGTADFSVKSDEVRHILGIAIFAYVLAASERRNLMGWTDSGWTTLQARTSQALIGVFG